MPSVGLQMCLVGSKETAFICFLGIIKLRTNDSLNSLKQSEQYNIVILYPPHKDTVPDLHIGAQLPTENISFKCQSHLVRLQSVLIEIFIHFVKTSDNSMFWQKKTRQFLDLKMSQPKIIMWSNEALLNPAIILIQQHFHSAISAVKTKVNTQH